MGGLVACSAGVLLRRTNVLSSLSFIRSAPWKKFLSLPSLPLPLKLKMAAIIFVKKILSTRSLKLRCSAGQRLYRKRRLSREQYRLLDKGIQNDKKCPCKCLMKVSIYQILSIYEFRIYEFIILKTA